MQLTTLETLLSLDRQANIIRYSEMVKDLEGDAMSYGLFRGGCLELLAKCNPHRICNGIDSFVGMPPSTDKDFHKEGDFKNVDEIAVDGYFRTMHRNVELYKGFAPEVFSKLNPDRKYAIVLIDVDLYESVKVGLDFFYPRLVDGGIIISDDWGWESVRGGQEAVEEFSKTITPTYQGEVFYYPNGKSNKQYIIVK